MEIALILAPKYSVGDYKVHVETAENVSLSQLNSSLFRKCESVRNETSTVLYLMENVISYPSPAPQIIHAC